MKNTITTCCSVLSHRKVALPIQMSSQGFGGITLSWQTMCSFRCSMSMLLCLYKGPTCSVKMGEVAMSEFWLVAVVQTGCPAWEVCWVTWGRAHLTSTQEMQRYPIASFKNDCFLRHLLVSSSRLIFCTAMLAGPIVGDTFYTNENTKPNWRYFNDPFWYHQLLAAGGAARTVVALQGPVSDMEVTKCQLCLCCTAHWVSHQASLSCINIINWKLSFSCGLNYSNRVLELCRSH